MSGKILGALMILAGCSGLGLQYFQEGKKRLDNLEQLLRMLDHLASEVRYRKAPLPECLSVIAERMEEPYRSTFWQIGQQQEEGIPVTEAYRMLMEECLQQTAAGQIEKEEILGVLSGGGYQDEELQLLELERCGQKLRRYREELEREWKEKGSLAVRLGVLGGIFLMIILL